MISKVRNSIGRAALLSALFIPLAFALPAAAHAQDRGNGQDRQDHQGGGHGQHQERSYVRPDSRPDAVDNSVRQRAAPGAIGDGDWSRQSHNNNGAIGDGNHAPAPPQAQVQAQPHERHEPERREQGRMLVQDDHRNLPRAPTPRPLPRPESPRYWHGYSQSHYDGRYSERDRYREEGSYRFRDRDRLLIRDYWAHRPRYHHVVLGGPVFTFYVGQLLPATVYVEPAPVKLVEVLQPVPYGYRYVISGDDVLLVDPYGVIVDVVDL